MQDDDFIVATPCNALSLFFDYAVFQFIACDVVYLPEEFVCHVLGNVRVCCRFDGRDCYEVVLEDTVLFPELC